MKAIKSACFYYGLGRRATQNGHVFRCPLEVITVALIWHRTQVHIFATQAYNTLALLIVHILQLKHTTHWLLSAIFVSRYKHCPLPREQVPSRRLITRFFSWIIAFSCVTLPLLYDCHHTMYQVVVVHEMKCLVLEQINGFSWTDLKKWQTTLDFVDMRQSHASEASWPVENWYVTWNYIYIWIFNFSSVPSSD